MYQNSSIENKKRKKNIHLVFLLLLYFFFIIENSLYIKLKKKNGKTMNVTLSRQWSSLKKMNGRCLTDRKFNKLLLF